MKLLIPGLFIAVLLVNACSTLTLKPADFAWPIESVLKIDDNGTVTEERYSLSFNTTGLFYEEAGDSLAYKNKELRIIRDSGGYYFVTAAAFKNVYVFTAEEGALKLFSKILISETGLVNPAFNQRAPYIELLNDGKSLYLTNTGIKKD